MILTIMEILRRLMTFCNLQVCKSEKNIGNVSPYFKRSNFNLTFLMLGTTDVFFAAYVLLFSIVIMNLLIGLAVSDIGALMEIARRESIISQINMINEMMDHRTSFIYNFFVPKCVKQLFER